MYLLDYWTMYLLDDLPSGHEKTHRGKERVRLLAEPIHYPLEPASPLG